MADLGDYLDITAGQAREQFGSLLARRPVYSGRQVTFAPVETLLCLAASYVLNHRHFGGSTAHTAPARQAADGGLPERESERILMAAARLGQHVFAQHVLANCGSQCVSALLRTPTPARRPPPARPSTTPARKYLDWRRANIFAA